MTTFDDARARIAGEGRFERGTAFEPVLVPLLAGDVAPTEVEFACAVGSMISRTDSWYGFPLFGIAVAHRLAPLVTVETAHRCIKTPQVLVSTNGGGFGHPHATAIDLVVTNKCNRGRVELVFNYRSKTTEPWADPDRPRSDGGYTATYPAGVSMLL